MKGQSVRQVLAELCQGQWGMVTAAQASAHGIGHMWLTRLTQAGELLRLSHGVYKDAGAPSGEYEDLRAAWLASDPGPLAWARLVDRTAGAVVSGESAAFLHGVGNLRAMRSEFTTPTRKQTSRVDIHYRTRVLPPVDVTIRHGLPVTTLERTIADLLEQNTQIDHVADVLRDSAGQSALNIDRLVELLAPLARRHGHGVGDGVALLKELQQAAGIDVESLAEQIVNVPHLGARVARDYLASLDMPTIFDSPAFAELSTSLSAAMQVVDTAEMRAVLEPIQQQVQQITQNLKKISMPNLGWLKEITGELAALKSVDLARRLSAGKPTDGEQSRVKAS